jgi:hypothetical protein
MVVAESFDDVVVGAPDRSLEQPAATMNAVAATRRNLIG